jgi:hypothetical protein
MLGFKKYKKLKNLMDAENSATVKTLQELQKKSVQTKKDVDQLKKNINLINQKLKTYK